jgi:hypothetical protein
MTKDEVSSPSMPIPPEEADSVWTPQQVRGDTGHELSPRTCCGVHSIS